MTRQWVLVGLIGILTSAMAVGCGDSTDNSGGDSGTGGTGGIPLSTDFDAKIVRTTYGVPHITADDFGSLGYGAGYAYAQDNFCILMEEVVRANGESAKYLGNSTRNQNRDYVYRFFNSDEFIETEFLSDASRDLQHLALGYAAGFNRYLEETGADSLPDGDEGCRDAAWVRPINDFDLAKVYRKLTLRAGISQVIDQIMAAEEAAPTVSMASAMPQIIESTPFHPEVFEIPEVTMMGSNAYGIGKEGSQTDAGLLLGNPHFPWQGPERWYVHHLTVPGKYDAMGASLQGVPVVNVGFNKDVAWSHTVSTAIRFGFFELKLTDDDPYKYEYDGNIMDITSHPVTIEVEVEPGVFEDRTKTIYMSQFGPVMDLGAFNVFLAGWPIPASNTVFAIRDANIDNTRILDQFFKMGQATSMDEFEDAIGQIGLPWVNTIAADRNGVGFYGDVSTVPHVTQEKLDTCSESTLAGLIVDLASIPTLDGSTSACNWGTDSDGPEGLLGYEKLPKLRTGGDVAYVSNSNDSYWLSNPNEPLEGFAPVFTPAFFPNNGQPPERYEQSLRTRQGFVQAEERIAGTDGLGAPGFNIDNLREIMFGSRNYAEELTRDDFVTICEGVADWSAGDCDGSPYSSNVVQAAASCAILEDWDGTFNNDSVGAGLWNEVWRRTDRGEDFWLVPFDFTDPVNTPNTLNAANAEVLEAVRCGLGAGVDFLVDNSIPLDRAWGEVQFRWNGDRTMQIPVHGGSGGFMWSVISPNFVEAESAYSNIRAGNSYIQTVTWDETDCPVAYAMLTYSQSHHPDSPHYSDWTEAFSDKNWNDMPFCDADIETEKISEIEISTDD